MITELDNPTADPQRTTALQHLGTEIRHARETAGLTRHELGAHAHLTYSTITKIENGHRFCHLQFAQLLDTLIPHTHGRFERLWHHVANQPPTPTTHTYLHHEAEATHIRIYHPHLIPDLAQTPHYTRALLTPTRLPHLNTILHTRTTRQHLLQRNNPPPPHLWIILHASALTHPPGDTTVMTNQLHHLTTLAENPHHRIQILQNAITPARCHPFTLLSFDDTPDLLHTHGYPRGHLTANPHDVTTARDHFDLLTTQATPPHTTPEHIHTALKEIN